MKVAEKVLRRLYRDRQKFSVAEVAEATAIIDAYNEERASRQKSVQLPTRFVAVGDEVVVSGRRFVCVERGQVWPPCEACKGCDLSRLYLGCGDLQCGPFDRKDRRFVWFKQVGQKIGTK